MDYMPVSKNDYAYHRLKEEIITGYLAPGEKLTVNTLSERYQVSTMPVRNAIQKLRSEGFVAITPRCGAKVHVWDYDEFNSLMQLSTVLEMTASKLAAFYIDEESIAMLNSLCKKMESAGMSRNYPQYEQYNHRFHFAIYENCGNPYLMEQISEMHEKTYPYTSISFHIEGRLKISMEQHKTWVKALADHDGETCAELCKTQRVQAYGNFLSYLENCLEHLDNPESNYYIYGFGSTFSGMPIEEIRKKLDSYHKSMELLN